MKYAWVKLILWAQASSVTEEFEDTMGIIRILESKKNRQHNGKNKQYTRTNNDPQTIHIKL